MTVDSDAPRAMFTTDCMRLARAARQAVSISGLAEISATTMAGSAGGTCTCSSDTLRVLALHPERTEERSVGKEHEARVDRGCCRLINKQHHHQIKNYT